MGHRNEIVVNELDFDKIKQDLIDQYKTDPVFSDYNFEGSGLNLIIDMMASGIHSNAIIANMSANEMFIDSAQLRQTVVSKAKEFAYTPRSVRSATAVVTFSFAGVTGDPQFITIPEGTRLSTASGHIFSTKEQHLAYPTASGSGTYEADDVEIYEGYFNSYSYTMDYSNPNQRFIIPSVLADVSTLIIQVIEGNTTIPFSKNDDINVLVPSSYVFFLHQNPDDKYEVTFGDGTLGFKPSNAAVIKLTYIIASGTEEANGILEFSKVHPIDGHSDFTVVASVQSYGGAGQETIDEIRSRSNKMYKSQNRAVITEDYENFMLTEYPFISSMSVWGGEYNVPPVYGKVFLAIKPTHTEFLSDNLKAKIKEELIKKYNVVTVIPEIVDPDYIYVIVNADVSYNHISATINKSEISTIINHNITTHFENTVEIFNAPFYFSPLVTIIDDSDKSIIGSLTEILLSKRFSPQIQVDEHRNIKFSNEIVPGTITSTLFNINGISGIYAKASIVDDGNGKIQTKNAYTGEIISNIGTIDYVTGELSFSLLVYDLPIDTKDIRIYVTPKEKNIFQGYNQIIIVDRSSSKEEYNRKAGVYVTVNASYADYK